MSHRWLRHLPLVPVNTPDRSYRGPCARGGAMGPYGGAHARCSCGERSGHLPRRERRAWHRNHRRDAQRAT